MGRLKCMELLGMCDRVGYTDMVKMAELTAKAKGKLNGRKFAKKCGLDPATISRLLNAKFKKNLSGDVVAALVVNAEEANGALLREFLEAQGLVLRGTAAATKEQSERLHEEFLENLQASWRMSCVLKAAPSNGMEAENSDSPGVPGRKEDI